MAGTDASRGSSQSSVRKSSAGTQHPLTPGQRALRRYEDMKGDAKCRGKIGGW